METPVNDDVLGSLAEIANLFPGVAGGQVLDSLCPVVFTARPRSWLGVDTAQLGDTGPLGQNWGELKEQYRKGKTFVNVLAN